MDMATTNTDFNDLSFVTLYLLTPRSGFPVKAVLYPISFYFTTPISLFLN